MTVDTRTIPVPRTATRWSLAGTRGVGPSDGAWWPQSADLTTEIADLDVAVYDILHERISRAAYTKGMWDAPRKVHTPLGITKLGWFTNARYPENIDLSLTGFTHLVLTVIPAGTEPHFADIVLADYGNAARTPNDAAGNDTTAAHGTDAWDNEGQLVMRRSARYGFLFD
jgi:hypothetical protein